MPVILSRVRTSQPQTLATIAQSSPLAQGLFGLLYGGAVPGGVDLVTKAVYPKVAGRLITAGGLGYGQATTGSAGGITSNRDGSDPNTNWRPATNKLTLAVVFTSIARGSNANIGGAGYGSASGYYIEEKFSDGSCLLGFSDGSFKTVSGPSGGIKLGALNVICATFDGANATLWVNGTNAGSVASSANLAYTLGFFHTSLSSDDADFTGAAINGHYMAGWSRPLSGAEIRALSVNPWQLFAPLPRRVWAAQAASGTTITCTVGNANATGVSALVSTTVQTGVGNANASGVSALVSITVQCGVGNANASGVSALLNTSIVCGVGNANASGVTASVSTASGTVVTCSVGNAQADALTAQLQRIFGVGIGAAIASGISASVFTGVPDGPAIPSPSAGVTLVGPLIFAGFEGRASPTPAAGKASVQAAIAKYPQSTKIV